MDLKVIVAAHKKYWMPNDEAYFPLQVGRAISSEKFYTGDDTGDNISVKNPNYCELTGIYWAWKNLKCDYIGLCHYRRYFAKGFRGFTLAGKRASIMGKEDYVRLLKQYDVILPQKRNYYIETIRSQYEHAHGKYDLDCCEEIVNELHPEYSDAFEKVMGGTKQYILNMFVMPRCLFDEYCAWLFPILFELERRIDISSYSQYNARVFGFLGERLFNVWLEKSPAKKVEVPIVTLEPVNWPKKIASFVKRKFMKSDAALRVKA